MPIQLSNSIPIPGELFHYTTPEGAAAIQSGLTLRFTPPDQLNDPFEFMPGGYEGMTESSVRKEMKHKQWLRELYEQMKGNGAYSGNFKEFKKKFRDPQFLKEQAKGIKAQLDNRDFSEFLERVAARFAIACFSETATDMLMWAHYTKNRDG